MTTASGWSRLRFDQVGNLVSGATPSTTNPSYWDGEIVWVTPNDLSKLRSRYLHGSAKRITEDGLKACSASVLPAGSVVISSRAPIGYAAIPRTPFCTNQGCKSIELGERFDSEFAYYNITFNVEKLKRVGEGTTFSEISKSSLSRIELDFPDSKAEQCKIAEVLANVDEAIEITAAIVAKQRRILSGLMQDLLTRGIDEHGDLRSEETHKYQDSSVGRIPEAWACSSLSRFVPSADYGISSSLGDSGWPVLRMNNLADGEADLADLKYTATAPPKALLLREGDVLFNRTNSWEHVGRTGIWREQIEEATFASYLVRLNPDPDLLIGEFLNWWLNWERPQIAMRRVATPAVQQVNINPTNLRSIPAAFPKSLEEQQIIVERLASVRGVVEQSSRELKKLERLKTALMQDLLTGKVRVTRLLDRAGVSA